MHAIERIGLRELVMSDGPAGARGTSEVEGETSISFPAPSAVSATWDRELAQRFGNAMAAEARRHEVDVILTPEVNLHRTPVGGRHFECYSEDPLLSGEIATAVIRGIQENGVATCVKHFIANESETARTEYIARIDERTFHEVYLAPFAHIFDNETAWSIMAAYNGLEYRGETASVTDHHHLLTTLLKAELDYDGAVISDWSATTTTAESALAGLDIVMPGPNGPWSTKLLAVIKSGEVPIEVIDDKVLRILRLAHRVGALADPDATDSTPVPDLNTIEQSTALARELAAQAMVVLRREDPDFPVSREEIRSVALIGPNAVDTFVQGGGSGHVTPDRLISPEEGLRAALPDAKITIERGGYARVHAPALAISEVANDPQTGEVGIRVEALDRNGTVVETWTFAEWQGWFRSDDTKIEAFRITADLQLTEPGEHWIGVGTVGKHSIKIDGQEISHSEWSVGNEVVINSSVNSPEAVGTTISVIAPTVVRLDATLQNVKTDDFGSFVRASLHHRLPGPSIDEEIKAAAAIAGKSDLTIVIVGTNDEVESEGWDRSSLDLPGEQDELVRQVLAVNPNAVIVVNAGAPVLLPWLSQARTVIWSWFPGQECGHALADVVLGRVEPAGRLPWTLPASYADVPIPNAIPDEDLILAYPEGIDVGYRLWERTGRTPALPFGHGLGWTDWKYNSAHVTAQSEEGSVTVEVSLTNQGARDGSEVIQAYLHPPTDDPSRPMLWLAGFTKISVNAAATASANLTVARRAFEIWDTTTHTWVRPSGTYRLSIGGSSTDLPIEITIEI